MEGKHTLAHKTPGQPSLRYPQRQPSLSSTLLRVVFSSSMPNKGLGRMV